MKKDCGFCKKMRQKILNKSNEYINFHNNIKKILDVKALLLNKKEIVYNNLLIKNNKK